MYYLRKHHTFIEEPGWTRFKDLAKRDKKLLRLQNQDNLRSYRTFPKQKFGYQTPRNNDYEYALSIAKNNGNSK